MTLFDTIWDYISSQSILTLVIYGGLIVFIIYIALSQKKKKPIPHKDLKGIRENLNKLNIYDDKSNEELKKHLETRRLYILSQAKQLQSKHFEILKANETLKRKYFKIEQQLKILEVK
ncbi:unnamed protein product [marine sediment metagenome]|uniref:Uncharacterized protein n=1 Tax=marine sediment metagenome TaxID=412755 RepID=X1R1E7_9ZZZZ